MDEWWAALPCEIRTDIKQFIVVADASDIYRSAPQNAKLDCMLEFDLLSEQYDWIRKLQRDHGPTELRSAGF